jgi:hypothetical protein
LILQDDPHAAERGADRGASGRKTKIKEDTTGFYRDPEKVSDHSS